MYCLFYFCLSRDDVKNPTEVYDLKVFRFSSIYSISLLKENYFHPLHMYKKKKYLSYIQSHAVCIKKNIFSSEKG